MHSTSRTLLGVHELLSAMLYEHLPLASENLVALIMDDPSWVSKVPVRCRTLLSLIVAKLRPIAKFVPHSAVTGDFC